MNRTLQETRTTLNHRKWGKAEGGGAEGDQGTVVLGTLGLSWDKETPNLTFLGKQIRKGEQELLLG